VQGVSELADLGGQPALACVQDTPHGIREAREVEGQELRQRAFGLIEAGLKLPRRGAQRRGGRGGRARRGRARIAEQGLAGRRVGGGLPRGEARVGLAGAEAVADDRVGQPGLLAARQAGERGGRRRREPARVDVRGHRGRQPPAQEQAARDPAAAPAEEPADLRGREVILVGERAHDARLVHRAQGPAGRVGLEQTGLGDDAGRLLEHHRHAGVPLARPLGEALEAVEHLVGAIAGWSHPQRQRGEDAGPISPRSA
jgi:hypothetical protein